MLSLLLAAMLAVPGWAEPARFMADSNGTVLDTRSSLMLLKPDSSHDMKKGMNWYEALEYVDSKNAQKFGGYDDWRLPTLNELQEIWDPQRTLASKDGEPIGLPGVFASGGSYYLWTGTEQNLNNAWYFGFGQHEDYWNLKDLGDLDQGVKLVRKAR